MNNPYRTLFAAHGAWGFSLAGLVARLPLPMTGIGIITMLSQLHGSYTQAGVLSASFILTYALLSPQISRLVDRYGQSRILPSAAAISVSGMLILLSSAWWETPGWMLFAGALLAGFMPSMSAMIRARWTALYRGNPCLQTAWSLETVLDEVSFIAGPPLAVGLSVLLFPQASLAATSLLLLVGVFALVIQRSTEPPVSVRRAATDGTGSVIRLPNVRLLTLMMVAMGIIVGSVDIVSVAFAGQTGTPAAASLVLSAYAAGSCLAGLIFGALQLQTPLHRLLLLAGFATAATTLPLPLVHSIPALAVAVLAAGVFFAPTMIVAMSLLERMVPERSLTEGMTWLLSGLNVGVALGAVVSGQVVDETGVQAGFTVTLCAGALVLLLALWGHQRLRADDVLQKELKA